MTKHTSLQAFKLYDFIQKTDLNVLSTRKLIADEATATLGFLVTESNVRGAMTQLEMDFPKPRNPDDDLRIVIKELYSFMTALGHNISPEFMELLK
jgi:hypothetical protein